MTSLYKDENFKAVLRTQVLTEIRSFVAQGKFKSLKNENEFTFFWGQLS